MNQLKPPNKLLTSDFSKQLKYAHYQKLRCHLKMKLLHLKEAIRCKISIDYLTTRPPDRSVLSVLRLPETTVAQSKNITLHLQYNKETAAYHQEHRKLRIRRSCPWLPQQQLNHSDVVVQRWRRQLHQRVHRHIYLCIHRCITQPLPVFLSTQIRYNASSSPQG
jgi:hypothetical protein